MSRQGMDVSNYSQPLTPPQLDWVRDNLDWVCIGLQDAAKARAFKAQLEPLGKQLMYYIERPNRDLSIPEAGAIVWVDIETGCFVERNETLQAIEDVKSRGLTPYIYGNRWSIRPVFGLSTELSNYPLVYADYRTPDLATFEPFNGWDAPAIWQYSSDGVAGINCDLNVSFEEEPMPNPNDGWHHIGNQWFLMNNGIDVLRIGDETGEFPGRFAKKFGGTWYWLRMGDVLLTDTIKEAVWSSEEGD